MHHARTGGAIEVTNDKKNMVLHPNKLGYNPYDYLKSIHIIPLMTGTGLSSSFSVLSLLFLWLWLKKVYLVPEIAFFGS